MKARGKVTREEIEVVLDADFLDASALVGSLFRGLAHGKEVFSFKYSAQWLQTKCAVAIDPRLQLDKYEFYPESTTPQFRVFLDSAPDRWGRVLMDRREALRAREGGRKARPLTELDYLLGVHDGCRIGALRFRRGETGPFLDDDHQYAAPPITSLRELAAAAKMIEDPKAAEDANYGKWLNLLFKPGSSLGGARPKANFADTDGSLWIAKFPGRNDRRDVGAWEFLVHTLAVRAGITVPPARLLPGDEYRTFACARFDRVAGRRRFFVSAMTLLGRNDADAERASYLNIAEVLAVNVGRGGQDLRELWTRLVFNILVGNRDDHLRNHGFIMVDSVWRLAPAFDVNPNIEKTEHALLIDATSAAADLDAAVSTAGYYGIQEPDARAIVANLRTVVSGWRKLASDLEISRSEVDLMAPAFME